MTKTTKRPKYFLCGRCFGKPESTLARTFLGSEPCCACLEENATLTLIPPDHPLLGRPIQIEGKPHEAFERHITTDQAMDQMLEMIEEVTRFTGDPNVTIEFQSTEDGLHLQTIITQGNIVATIKASNQYHGE